MNIEDPKYELYFDDYSYTNHQKLFHDPFDNNYSYSEPEIDSRVLSAGQPPAPPPPPPAVAESVEPVPAE